MSIVICPGCNRPVDTDLEWANKHNYCEACHLAEDLDHPFTEFHKDSEIGHLIWKLRRLGGATSDSQTSSHIQQLKANMERIGKELTELRIEYNRRKETA
jgi:hypothetical protein